MLVCNVLLHKLSAFEQLQAGRARSRDSRQSDGERCIHLPLLSSLDSTLLHRNIHFMCAHPLSVCSCDLQAQTALVHGRVVIFELNGLRVKILQRTDSDQQPSRSSREAGHEVSDSTSQL